MNYEKKYKEALEKARQFSEHPLQEDSSSIVEYIFPELQESEDERIRKELIEHCRNIRCVTEEGAESIAKWIAWLEKQGGTSKEWTISDAATFKELIDFLENGTAKLQHDLTRYANWLKIQFTPIEKQGEKKTINQPDFEIPCKLSNDGNNR